MSRGENPRINFGLGKVNNVTLWWPPKLWTISKLLWYLLKWGYGPCHLGGVKRLANLISTGGPKSVLKSLTCMSCTYTGFFFPSLSVPYVQSITLLFSRDGQWNVDWMFLYLVPIAYSLQVKVWAGGRGKNNGSLSSNHRICDKIKFLKSTFQILPK